MYVKHDRELYKLPEFEFMSVGDNLDRLTQRQMDVWNHFYKNKKDTGPIDKKEINPIELSKYLPLIWMADLIKDDDGKLVDFSYRLIGTKLTPIYGERTGQKLLSDDNPDAMKKVMPIALERITKVISSILETKSAVYSRTYYKEKQRQHLNVSGITIPVCKDGEDINMVFGYVDLNRSIV